MFRLEQRADRSVCLGAFLLSDVFVGGCRGGSLGHLTSWSQPSFGFHLLRRFFSSRWRCASLTFGFVLPSRIVAREIGSSLLRKAMLSHLVALVRLTLLYSLSLNQSINHQYAGSRDVFAGIEFYLPQLAHMIIHLEVNWDDAILERFALIIAQQSLHFALQLNWILQGTIEDYQPEKANGEPNEDYNALFYSRCIKLLSNIERCVVYGRPRSMELQRLYEKGNITKKEYDILEHADRRFNAFQIVGEDKDGELSSFGGTLLYKRKARKSRFKPKGWKTRFFSVEERMLNCYNKKGGSLVRSMPLEGAVVENETDGKYPHMFSVSNRNFHFTMRAESNQDKMRWMNELEEESRAQALFTHGSQRNADHLKLMEDLTPSQRTRFDFFKDERDFVRNVCDIAEQLRFVERAERKNIAPGLMKDLSIPPCTYNPLCNSTSIWRRVEKTVWKDTRVFNTKARCPVIMYFVSRRGERMRHHRGGMKDVNLDVAEYMHLQYDLRDDPEEKDMAVIEELDDDVESGMKSPHESTGDLQSKADAAEEVEERSEKNGEELKDSGRGSVVRTIWHEDSTTDTPRPSRDSHTKGNRQVQSFMRENLVSLPRKLATRMESRRRLSSIIDKKSKRGSIIDKLPMTSVPILETLGEGADDADESMDGEQSVVSVERASVMVSAGSILRGDMHQGGIDLESIDRAIEVICHGESWAEKSARMLREHGSDEAEGVAEVLCLMAKSNDDLRQEVFVMQMIHYYKSVFTNANLPLWLKTYNILSTSKDTGLIEVLTDATSIDGLKKSEGYPAVGGLRAYFEQTYGGPDSGSFKEAQKNFMQSLCAYSLVSYLLGLKDRHNGNIMIDTRGHLIHIDFGFAMGMAPGHEFCFERAPFKLTKEYVDVMGGPDSECYAEFKRLFVAGFNEARNSSQIALGLVEIMMFKSNYPCFSGFRYGHGVAIKRFERRLMLHTRDDRVEKKAVGLVT
jgi:phosphatidylinositol 4-kinase